jgi:hypothetical protein
LRFSIFFVYRWAGDDNVKEDLIILENLYPQVRKFFLVFSKSTEPSFFKYNYIIQVRKVFFCKI